MTVLVSTHYMDEAERCHRLGYIAYGRLLASGTPRELVANSGLHTWQVSGATQPLFAALNGQPGIELITRFGNTLHLSGRDPALSGAKYCPLATPARYPVAVDTATTGRPVYPADAERQR